MITATANTTLSHAMQTYKNKSNDLISLLYDAKDTKKSQKSDYIDLSPDGIKRFQEQKLIDIFDIIFKRPNNGEVKSFFDIGLDLEENFSYFSGLLNNILSISDVLNGQEAIISPNLKGGVEILNDHPNSEKIKSIFKNSHVIGQFMTMAARSAILDAAATEPNFQKDYQEDPIACIKKHISALEERLKNFQFKAGTESMDILGHGSSKAITATYINMSFTSNVNYFSTLFS